MDGIGAFLDLHNGLITAAATIVIAAFTIVLALVTNRQAKLTRQALITTERAFVFLEDFDTEWTAQVQPLQVVKFTVKPRWRNNGTTPTRNMKVTVNWTEWMGDLPDGFEYLYGQNSLKMFLGPQATEWSTPIEIPPHVATNAANGNCKIFFWGRVDYDDIFSGTQHHFTQWCYRVQFRGHHPPQFIAHGEYNRSDEDT